MSAESKASRGIDPQQVIRAIEDSPDLMAHIAEGEAQIRAGQTMPFSEILAEARRADIVAGEADIAAGRVHSHEEVLAMVSHEGLIDPEKARNAGLDLE